MRLDGDRHTNTFICALRGIKDSIKTEKNLRFDFIMAACVLILAFVLKITFFEWIICIVLIGSVISAEIMNTAIEAVVDLDTREKNPLAKKAKDAAAGAVLVLAIISAVIGCVIFIPKITQILFES